MRWLSRIWHGTQRDDQPARVSPRDEDAELAELAALIEGDDLSEAKLERMADLIGQTDRAKLI